MALASLDITVTAVEMDETTAACATMNLIPFRNATVVHSDAAAFELDGIDGVWLDPARRTTSTSGTKRLWDPEDFSPPLSFVESLGGAGLAGGIDRAVFPFSQGGPHMHSVAAKAVALGEAARPEFALYAHQVVANARALADALAGHGLRVATGGTDTHLIAADVSALGVTGMHARGLCAAAGIVLDKYTLPYDTQPCTAGSGIRLGTAAVTTQGMREEQMPQVADLIVRALREERGLASEVAELVGAFPPYPG
jgi:hypothetical protein